MNETQAIIEHFNEAFNRHDVDQIMALMTDDCRFEDTEPFPDGTTYIGQAAVRARWQALFHDSPQAVFHTEETIALRDRCVVRWRYEWGGNTPQSGHIRGVDVFRVQDGKVAEKLSYVKG